MVSYLFELIQTFQGGWLVFLVSYKLVNKLGEVLVKLFKALDEQAHDDAVRVVEYLLAPLSLKKSQISIDSIVDALCFIKF